MDEARGTAAICSRLMPATCAFCAIISGETEAVIILQTERLIAFLDHRPLFRGHTLLVPKLHVRLLSDLPPQGRRSSSPRRSGSSARWKTASAPTAR